MKTISVGIPFIIPCEDQDGEIIPLDGSEGAIDRIMLHTRQDNSGEPIIKEHTMAIVGDGTDGQVIYTIMEGDIVAPGMMEMEVVIYYEDGRVIPSENRLSEYVHGSIIDEQTGT